MQVIGGVVGQPFEPAHSVVRDKADHAAHQGGQRSVTRAAQGLDRARKNIER